MSELTTFAFARDLVEQHIVKFLWESGYSRSSHEEEMEKDLENLEKEIQRYEDEVETYQGLSGSHLDDVFRKESDKQETEWVAQKKLSADTCLDLIQLYDIVKKSWGVEGVESDAARAAVEDEIIRRLSASPPGYLRETDPVRWRDRKLAAATSLLKQYQKSLQDETERHNKIRGVVANLEKNKELL